MCSKKIATDYFCCCCCCCCYCCVFVSCWLLFSPDACLLPNMHIYIINNKSHSVLLLVLLLALPLEEPLHCSFGTYHHCTFFKLVFHVKWWWHNAWMWKTYRSADCVCTHEMVLVRLAFPKSKVLHNLLFRTMPIFCATLGAVVLCGL